MAAKSQIVEVEEFEGIGPQWDAMSEEERLAQLLQLQIGNKACYWNQLSVDARKKIYNAWRKWGARCE